LDSIYENCLHQKKWDKEITEITKVKVTIKPDFHLQNQPQALKTKGLKPQKKVTQLLQQKYH